MVERVAITGAAGFLGAHLVDGFERRKVNVLPLVRTLDARSTRWRCASTLEATLGDPTALDGCDVLVHAAAVRHRHGVSPADYQASNVALVGSLLRAAAGRVRRVVLVSSVGVYGFPKVLPVTEEHPYSPVTTYSQTKVEAERLASSVAPELGVELCIVRPTIVYGPSDTNGMLDKMVRMIRAGSYRIVGSGENALHHTHVDDIVEGILLAASHPAAAGEHFILCGPETITLSRLSVMVARAVGGKLPRIHVPLPAARLIATGVDCLSSLGLLTRDPPINNEKLDVMTEPIAFDAGKARRLLGYRPRVGYEEGLRRTLGNRA
jgi:dihydroflavonol-4-reductase